MKHIPNILTLSNLFCGSIASILAIKSPDTFLPIIIVLICLSLIFDFFDGFVARAVKSSGELGKQLDSLADMVTFGFFPGVIMVNMLSQNTTNAINETSSFNHWQFTEFAFIPFLGLLITLFSALRLAIFNLDKDQAYYFKGLPTPANTIFILSLYYLQQNHNFELLNNIWMLLAITLLFSYLLVAKVPLFALKFKNFTWKDNALVFSFLILCLLLIILLKVVAIPILIVLYIIISIIFRKKIISNGTSTS